MKKGSSLFALLIIFTSSVFAQSNLDDFWLNNGFTDGQTINTNAGYFYDDGGNGDYIEGAPWSVQFCSENGNPITLDFTGFSTHFDGPPPEGDDYMSINYPEAPPGGYIAYHDDTPEFSFTSQTCIDFEFTTDGDGNVHSGWVAEIYAIPAPFNNDPADAEVLTVGNVCSPSFYSNKGAYNSTGLGSPPCKEYFGGDVWFKLVVPASGVVKIETFEGTLNYAILDIYSSTDNTITAGERIACVDDGGVMPSVTLNRTPGETLYIRLFGEQAKSGLFGICASDPSSPVTGFTGPGGVGDSVSIDFWFKPETGVLNASGLTAGNGEKVETWSDQSGNDNHLLQSIVGLQPEYTDNLTTDFGGVSFDGVDDLFEVESGSGDAPLHWFAAGSFVGAQRQTMISIGDANINKTASLSKHSDQDYFSFTTSDRYGPPLTDSEYYIFHASHETNSQYHFLELNGASQTVDAVPSALETDGSVQIGASWDDTDPFNGNISELIQYRKSLNAAQSIIVNNYLAAKFDISPVSNDYYDWTNSYHYDVAGIGRVDINNTHTKAESAGILAISGADDLDDNEFLLFGHDNGNFTTWSSANVPVGDTNIVRLDRLWKVDIAGDPGTVSISMEKAVLPPLPAGFIAYNIYVDADGDFSSGASAFGPFEIGAELIINNISLNKGDHLAVAAVRPVLSFVSNMSEELESVSNPTIEVQLNYAVSNIVEVDYVVTGGTAIQGTDYSLLPSSISINPGMKSGNIIPLIIEDTIAEIPDEYFDIDISSSTAGISIGTYSTNRHTILNNDLEVNAYYIGDSITGECNTSTAELRVEAIGTGPFTYSWNPIGSLDVADNDTVIASPVTTTLYTVEVSDGFAQTRSDTIRVIVIPAPDLPLVTINGSNSFCEGDSVNLSAPSGYAAYDWSTLETSDNIWVKASGSYNVIVTDTFGCESPVSADAVITVHSLPDPPTLTMDGLTIFCDGDSVILIAESTYTTYLWSDLSTNDSLTVKIAGDYYLTATDGNGCSSSESDTITVSVLANPPKPAVTPDGLTTFCADDSVKLSAPPLYTEYTWSNASSTEVIYVNTTGDYTVTVKDGNGCSSEISDPISVTVNTLPTAPTIVPDGLLVFCEGGSVNLEPTGLYPSYTWSDGFSVQNRLVDATGDFAVMVVDGNGCESPYSDSVSVTENPLPAKPAISLLGPAEFCNGESTILRAPLAYANYLWSDGSSNDSLIVTTTGLYDVIVTDGNGCVSVNSDQESIVVNPNPGQPLVSPDGPTTFCDGDSVKLFAPVGYASYLWNTTDTTEEIYAITSGSFDVIVTDINECSSVSSLSVAVTVNSLPAAPTINPDGPLSFCDGGSVTLDGVHATETIFTWSDGLSGQSRLVESSGEFAVRVEDSNACLSNYSDSVNVEEYLATAKPSITVTGLLEFCEGDSVTLTAPAGYAGYMWSDGSTSETLVVKTTGTYDLYVTDANTCDSELSDPVVIQVNTNPAAAVVTPLSATTFCEGESVDLQADLVYNSYNWSDGGAGQINTISTSGTYYIIGEDANGCSSDTSNKVDVIVNEVPEKPVITADGPLFIITGESVTLSATASDAYLWSPGAQITQDILVTASGDYSVVVDNSFGCSSEASDILAVTVSDFLAAPEVTIDGSLQFCEGGVVGLAGPVGFTVYTWSNGATGQELTVTESGTFILVVTDGAGHTSLPSDDIIVQVDELPVLSLVSTTEPLCFGDENGGALVSSSAGMAPYTYTWNNAGGSDEILSGVSAGTYNVSVQDQNSCIDDLDVIIDQPEQIFANASITPAYCPDFIDGVINLSIEGGVFPYSVVWSDGGADDNYDNLGPGTYTYTVYDANNCEITGTAVVTYTNEVCFEIPEVITPNGDSYNDYWLIEGLEVYPNVVIEVFDRWGKRVFYSEGHDVYFDGTFSGKELPMESYHYIIDLNNGAERIVGNITILR